MRLFKRLRPGLDYQYVGVTDVDYGYYRKRVYPGDPGFIDVQRKYPPYETPHINWLIKFMEEDSP